MWHLLFYYIPCRDVSAIASNPNYYAIIVLYALLIAVFLDLCTNTSTSVLNNNTGILIGFLLLELFWECEV